MEKRVALSGSAGTHGGSLPAARVGGNNSVALWALRDHTVPANGGIKKINSAGMLTFCSSSGPNVHDGDQWERREGKRKG